MKRSHILEERRKLVNPDIRKSVRRQKVPSDTSAYSRYMPSMFFINYPFKCHIVTL